MSTSNTTIPAINAVNKTKYGDIPLLTSINYNSWQRTVLRVLQEIDLDAIISGGEDEAQPLDINYKDYKKRSAKAANTIPISCSPDVKFYIDHLTAPKDMWEILETLLDTSATRSGRTTLLRQFRRARPKGTDEPITEYFCRLLHYRQQLHGTNDQISDGEFRTHVYTTIPDQFAMTIEVLMGRASEPSVEEVIATIQQKASTAAIAKDISDPNGNFNTAMYASTSDNRDSRRGGFRGRGRGGDINPIGNIASTAR